MSTSFRMLYIIPIEAVHRRRKFPWLKCLSVRINLRARDETSSPSASAWVEKIVSYSLAILAASTGVSLMCHRSVADGLDFGEVQLTETTSPTLFVERDPQIRGPSVGSTESKRSEIETRQESSEANESIYSFVQVKGIERGRKGERRKWVNEWMKEGKSLIHLLCSCICIFNFVRATFLLPTNHLRESAWPFCVCFSTSDTAKYKERERGHKVPYAIPWAFLSLISL